MSPAPHVCACFYHVGFGGISLIFLSSPGVCPRIHDNSGDTGINPFGGDHDDDAAKHGPKKPFANIDVAGTVCYSFGIPGG